MGANNAGLKAVSLQEIAMLADEVSVQRIAAPARNEIDVANHHKHVHHKEDEPSPRNISGTIILILILASAARAATHVFPGMDPRKIVLAVAIVGAALFLWILNPRKNL
jgi:hypothetical protein